ncbi:MAG: ATP-dependent sacrificial sulfur transferase LarE, partial [Candidatus Eremiobacteraeota bacterium]|nr:ATP-dependent sacrificial sulfur transferase LarE [Candidatus Eremiobacteraeota bacterium]
SGGVDSSFLALVAHRALGAEALIVTAVSPSLARTDLDRARRIAARFNFHYQEVETKEMERPDYVANGPDRCYHCKTELFEFMDTLLSLDETACLCYGAIPEDQSDHRPGARAAVERKVRAPLSELGLTKPAIRRLSRYVDLETWSLPSQACLASRIAYHTPVTTEKLEAVDLGEEFLKGLGFETCRVRHHEQIARIEVPPERLGELLEHREVISRRLRELGFTYVTCDLMGLRSGSMNESLKLRVIG